SSKPTTKSRTFSTRITERVRADGVSHRLPGLIGRSGLMKFLSSKRVAPYLFLLPIFLFGLVMFGLPLLYSAYISLTSWDSLAPPRWVGLDNYIYLLTRDRFFFASLFNTFYFAFGTILIGVPIALVV